MPKAIDFRPNARTPERPSVRAVRLVRECRGADPTGTAAVQVGAWQVGVGKERLQRGGVVGGTEAPPAPCPARDYVTGIPAPWKRIDDLEIAAVDYIDWFSHRRCRWTAPCRSAGLGRCRSTWRRRWRRWWELRRWLSSLPAFRRRGKDATSGLHGRPSHSGIVVAAQPTWGRTSGRSSLPRRQRQRCGRACQSEAADVTIWRRLGA